MLNIRRNRKKEIIFTAPPSKAHTLRAFFLAALSKGRTRIIDPLMGKDQLIALKILPIFGAKVHKNSGFVEIEGVSGKLVLNQAKINCGNSGVTLRFISSILALSENGSCIVDGNKEMRKRTIEDLIDALKILNIRVEYLEKEGFPPIKIYGGRFKGGNTTINGENSSQFLSSLLIASACTDKGLDIDVKGNLVSRPYVDITLNLMKKFGVSVKNEGYKHFKVIGNQIYSLNKEKTHNELIIEGDYSNSSYFFLAAAICKIKVTVKNLNPKSTQGDKKILEILKMMGCKVIKNPDNSFTVIGGDLHGISIDMANYPDIVPTIAVAAAFAENTTIIKNVGHLKHKESNRLRAIARELNNMGINSYYTETDLTIEGGNPSGATIKTYNDHRIAMSFAIAGLKIDGVQIQNPKTVSKSFPDFFNELTKFSE
ncbi:MAG: 3-phosphoshikimate 1-carboxyvinyltransferase [Promethearchaeota archaeon]